MFRHSGDFVTDNHIEIIVLTGSVVMVMPFLHTGRKRAPLLPETEEPMTTICSDSRTSRRLLANIASAQLTLRENIAPVLLILAENELTLW
jgi:hypothetical protein